MPFKDKRWIRTATLFLGTIIGILIIFLTPVGTILNQNEGLILSVATILLVFVTYSYVLATKKMADVMAHDAEIRMSAIASPRISYIERTDLVTPSAIFSVEIMNMGMAPWRILDAKCDWIIKEIDGANGRIPLTGFNRTTTIRPDKAETVHGKIDLGGFDLKLRKGFEADKDIQLDGFVDCESILTNETKRILFTKNLGP